ncbi:MAG: type II toxin-antitoxin system HicB family antitoxin [Treponema sp.]|nr:type II toxin-antitoxin system HicB family antitoxin [Treponema sp.]
MNTYNAIIEKDGDWYFGYALEVPGANGQGRTIEECKDDLAKAIELVLRDLEISVLY